MEREIAKEKFYATKAKVLCLSAKTKTNSKYLIGYLDKAIGPLVLIMPQTSGYVKTFKVKEGDNKLFSYR